MIFIKKIFLFFIVCIFILIISYDFSFNDKYFFPVEKHDVISSHYGYRYLYGTLNFHTGVDFPVVQNTSVHSFSSGIVKYANFLNGYGNCIIITHENNYRSLYAHLSENYIVHVGQYVHANEIIGYVGPVILSSGIRNGNTTGVHLHFELYSEKGDLIDPLSLKYSN